MSSASSSATNEEFDYERHRQSLAETVVELKKSIDAALDMRVQSAELELELTSQYNPELQAKLKLCRELADKCECQINSPSK